MNFIGERVIRDGLLTEVSAGDDADCSLAWVTTIDEAQRQEKRWETVVAVVPTNAVPWYWAYGVMKLATKRVIFVGPDQAVKAIGRTRAARASGTLLGANLGMGGRKFGGGGNLTQRRGRVHY